jgi:PTS system nitrogen regulatory IIA component
MTTASGYLTLKQVAKLLQLDYWTVSQHARNGTIPAFKIGGQWRVDVSALDQWVKERTSGG